MNSLQAVIDANIAIPKLIPTAQTAQTLLLWDKFQRERVSLYAPRLWVYEITSAIQKYLATGQISEAEKDEAIKTALEMNIHFVEDSVELCIEATSWAKRMNQMVAYDGFYLATAEQLKAPLWTADKRLVANADQLGVKWVHWLGDLK
ncbi:MAG: type II toxin-antitoxin system VapC family toxin [Chloroflexi bacterium]|nr:type II toxin-antitoxin system VapC family toxin [Chloroflexota bacterium]